MHEQMKEMLSEVLLLPTGYHEAPRLGDRGISLPIQ